MLQKGVYPYKYEKEDFCNHLNLEDITDANYTQARRVCKDFKIRNFVDYHDLCVQSDTLLLADVNDHFLSAPGLACQAALKRTKVKLDPLIDIDT